MPRISFYFPEVILEAGHGGAELHNTTTAPMNSKPILTNA